MTLFKDGGPLGLSIIGGSDHFCVPFGISSEDPGIYISKVKYLFLTNLARRLLKLKIDTL